MRRAVIIGIAVAVIGGGIVVYNRNGSAQNDSPATTAGGQQGQGGGAGGGRGGAGRGGGAFARPPMTVELAPVERTDLTEHVTVVGNLIGAATVEVVPKTAGRLQSIDVRMGDRVSRGQRLAKLEDSEIREQVKQAAASFEVARAAIRQREADIKLAETSLERTRNLYGRQLLPQQTLEDAEAKYQAANAQLDLARAQLAQAQARLEELQINLSNTVVPSPVDGFVARRYLDPGGFASANTPIVSVVDIRRLRLVVNVIEKDLHRVHPGLPGAVEVDAYPGETFAGEIARVAPSLDPATRTAPMEIDVPNPGFRLKPGMYARVRLTVDRRPDALVVPRTALVDLEGKRGVFVAANNVARFKAVETGLQDDQQVEIRRGVDEGDRVITTGAAALRDGDPILLPGQRPGGGRPGQGGPRRAPGRS